MPATQRTPSASNPVVPHPILPEYYGEAEERRNRVDGMFDASARHYDWICSAMSFGSGRLYRRQALQRAGVGPGHRVLDVGSGTGAVALLAQELTGSEGLVAALDPSRGMLSVGAANGVERPTQGLGESLPFPDDFFDFVTMSYALRHVADLSAAFSEYLRVLKPGGTILLLEITRPEGQLTTKFLALYMRGIVPTVTRMFRGSKEAQELMRYYWDTIYECVPPARIMESLSNAGAREARRYRVMGIFSEYTALK